MGIKESPTTKSATKAIAESHRKSLVEADTLLRGIVLEDRQANFGEATYFSREVGWDDVAIKRQIRRMHNVIKFQAIAGSTGDRKASAAEAETAAEIVEKELPKLLTQIEKLQAKADGFERDARLSAKRVEEQAGAVQRLRGLTPEDISGSVNQEVGTIKTTIGQDIRDAECRINELECCLTPSKYPSEIKWLESLQRSFRDAVVEGAGNGMIRLKLSPAWHDIEASAEAELEELQSKLPDLKSQYAEKMEAVQFPLDHYSN